MRLPNAITPWAILAAGLLFAAAAQAQDIVTVATVTGSGTVDVPVYIRDTSGFTLGIDQPFGSRIQSYSLKVDYAPAADVQSITFTRAGITAPLTPSFEAQPSAAGAVTLIDTFNETTNLIPFTLDAAAPGNQVGHLTVTLTPGLTPGTIITLTLDASLTQLANESGATVETVSNGHLTLVDGQITVTAPAIPTLSSGVLALLAAALAAVALRALLDRPGRAA